MEGSWVIFGVIAAFLIGYILGKQVGIKKGYKEGCAETPILLRQISLEKGACYLCQRSVDFWECHSQRHICQQDKE